MVKYGYGSVNIAKNHLPFDVTQHLTDKNACLRDQAKACFENNRCPRSESAPEKSPTNQGIADIQLCKTSHSTGEYTVVQQAKI